MFGDGKRIKDLKEEIAFLRNENKELRVQLVAMSNKSSEYWNAKLASKKPPEIKDADSVVSKINARQPKNEKERRQQEQAARVAKRLFAGS